MNLASWFCHRQKGGCGAVGMMARNSAAAIANEFLEFGWAERGIPPIGQLKLQKLIYYAHAWGLAIRDEPLFDEALEAWPWGPVVRDIYFETRQFGRAPITKHVSKLEVIDRNILDVKFIIPRVTDLETMELLQAVWKTHKDYSGTQLSNSTHAPGEPWTIIKNHYGPLDSKPTIPNELIKAVFKAKMTNEAS